MPFDLKRLIVTGGAVPVQQGIQQASAGGQSAAAQVAWSDHGTFVFVPGSGRDYVRALIWTDRQGKEEFPSAPHRAYNFGGSGLRLSPDGSQLAVAVFPDTESRGEPGVSNLGAESDIWVWHIARGSLTRLTFTGRAYAPMWTIDGRRICHDDGREAVCQAADGSGQPEPIFKAEGLDGIRAVAPDGKRLLFSTNVKANFDIQMATLGTPLEVRPLIQTPFSEMSPAISPNGRWVAYSSNESGRFEVYIRPFPAVGQGRWQVSTDGGSEPRWARNGRELFFTVGGGASGPPTILAASVQPGATFVAARPTVVLKLPNTSSFAYDVAPDGRFLLHRNASAARDEAPRPQIVMVQNWFEELKARMRSNSTSQ